MHFATEPHAHSSTSRGSVIATSARVPGEHRPSCGLRQLSLPAWRLSRPPKSVQRWPRFVAFPATPLLRPPERSATAGYIGCESLDEAEPLQQLSKLDVVGGDGAEQENQLEPAHSHRSSSYLVRLARANRLPVLEPVSRGTPPGSRRSTRLAFTSPSVRLKGTMPEARRMTGCAPGNEQCVCLSSEGSVQRNDTWVAQNRAGKTCTGFEGSGNARRRRAKGTLAQLVRDRSRPAKFTALC